MTAGAPTFALRHAYTGRCTGNYSGGDHIVVATGELASGRLRRKAGDALCKPASKFWGLYPGHDHGDRQRDSTCKSCLAKADRLGIDVESLSHDTRVDAGP